MCPAATPLSRSRLTVAISTIGTRVDTLRLPDPVAGICYQVLVQDPPDPLPQVDRDDIRYISLANRGLSHSRNSALSLCETSFLVFSDDDIGLNTKGLLALAVQMQQAPHLAFAVGWRRGKRPQLGHRAGPYRLHKLNTGRICAPELMLRIAPVQEVGVQFDTRFGVGAPCPFGEEYIFLCDMLDAGLKGHAYPIETGAHSGPSTGDNWYDPDVLSARGAVIERCFGRAAGVVRLAYAVRHCKRLGGWAAAWQFAKGHKTSA